MLIIIEGPDGSGKTFLAQMVASRLGQTTSDKIEVWHAKAPTLHPLDEYLRPLRDYRPGTGRHLILDRWHWGEAVYPKIRGRQTLQDPPVWWSIEAYLRRLGAVVVSCDLRQTLDYRQTYHERGMTDDSPDVWQLTHLNQIRLEFNRTSYQTQLRYLNLHTYADFADVDEIIELARTDESLTGRLNDFVTYSGPVKPTALLLGDVRNPNGYDGDDPAFLSFRGSSGYYLLSSLTAQPSPRDWVRSIGLANACDIDNPAKLWMELDRPPVVALGSHASRRLTDLGISHGKVPHPQYVRRFHHKLHVEYAWTIYNAARYQEDYSKWPQSSTPTTDDRPTPTSSPISGSSGSSDAVATATPST